MKISILIVDDSKTDRYVLRRRLDRCPFDTLITELSDGQEAIEFFSDYEVKRAHDPEKFPPLLVFLDINMPRVNGFGFLEAFDKIREEHGIKSTVVIMFTSSPLQEDKDRAQQWSFVRDFIVKGSLTTDDLQTVIRTQLDLPD